MKHFINWVRSLKWTTLVIVVLIIGGIFFFLQNNGEAENQTLVVNKGDFVKQVFVSGNVRATNNVDLGFAQGGRISGVYSKVGDTVFQGRLLAEIENGDLRALILQKQATLENEMATLLSLEQGTRPEELAVIESEIAKNEASLSQANQELLNTIRDSYDVADDAIRNQVDQFISNPRSLQPQVSFIVPDSNTENRIESSRVAIESALNKWNTDLFNLTSDGDLDKAESHAKVTLSSVTSILVDSNSALNQGIGNSSDINDWITDVSSARTAVNLAVSNLTMAITAKKNAISLLNISKKNLALSLAGSTEATIAAQAARIRAAEADVVSSHAQLAKTLITAPFNGVVTRMESKVGAVASSNSTQISLISKGSFEIESFIPEVDIAEIKVGNYAKVTLDAYGDGVIFDAKVSFIDPAETVRDGVSTYKTILTFVNQDERIRSGMTANIIITIEEKTGVISIPQKIVIIRDSKKIVVVRENGKDIEREVETGNISSLGSIEIVSGLKEGDVVVLAPSIK